MSASTERLVEQIKTIELAIGVAMANGHDVSALNEDLRYLQRKLVTCNEALTEGKTLLKG